MAIFDEPSRKPLPITPELGDHKIAVIKGTLGSIPILGGAFAEELGLLLAPPLARRRDDWFEDLACRLLDLERMVKGFHFEDLTQNEQFVSATVQATQSVLRTHHKEKLDALRNAILNVALAKEQTGSRHEQFLALIDRFTPYYLRLLRFFDDPADFFRKCGKPLPVVPVNTSLLAYRLISDAMPDFVEQTRSPVEERTASSFQFVNLLLGDLVTVGLINLQRLNETWTVASNGGNPVTTHLGQDFLAFITAEKIKPE